MSYKKIQRHNDDRNKGDYENDPFGQLAAQIVIHAIADWRCLIRSRAWEDKNITPSCNFAELRAFFTGEWCEFLMQKFDVTPARVLEILEAELAAAQQLPPKQKKSRKGQ